MKYSLTARNYRSFVGQNSLSHTFDQSTVAFIGQNNAGKSSAIRLMYELRPIFSLLRSPDHGFSKLLARGKLGYSLGSVLPNDSEIFPRRAPSEMRLKLEVDMEGEKTDYRVPLWIELLLNQENKNLSMTVEGFPPEYRSDTAGWHNNVALAGGSPVCDFGPYFESLGQLARCTYIGPFRNALNFSAGNKYFDLDIGQSVITGWSDLKSGADPRRRQLAIEIMQTIGELFGYRTFDLTAARDGSTFIVTADQSSYRLEELGGGLAQFVIVLANIAMLAPSYVIVDEPELGLHFSKQRVFVDTLRHMASHGLIMATHSLSLARASADRIYLVRTEGPESSSISALEEVENISQLIADIGLEDHSKRGFRKVLIVEGKTDMEPLNEMLRKSGCHDVYIWPFWGKAFINQCTPELLQHLKKMCDPIEVVIDSERRSADAQLEAKRAKFVESCEEAGIPCHVLRLRSLENYYSDRVVKKVFGEQFREFGPYGSRDAGGQWWAKSDGWKLAREMTVDELQGSDLGEIISKIKS